MALFFGLGAAPAKGQPVTVGIQAARMPVVFEPNVGQAPANQMYLSHAGPAELEFSRRSFSLVLPEAGTSQALSVVLLGANRKAHVAVSERQLSESNYLLGNQPSAWRTHVPNYGRIRYADIYPGIDLLFYGNGGRLEHDFVVAPGANYRTIRMRYQGARKLTVSPEGDLHVSLASGAALLHAPQIYQNVEGRRKQISGGFRLIGKDEVAFTVAAFNPSLPLIIDPVLDWSTYLADLSIYVQAMTLDSAGNTYIAGQTFSSSYPVTSSAYQTTCPACATNQPVVFVTKLNATGSGQLYSTFLGGSSYNEPDAIAVDANGDAVVTGRTSSSDFPLKNPISAGTPSVYDGFVTSLAPDGASLNFSSRLGGTSVSGTSATTLPGAVAVDINGNVYVAGVTESSYLPVTSGALNAGTPSYQNGNYVFLTKLQPTGAVSYGAILGATGAASECCSVVGLTVDSSGDAYLAGTVGSGPTSGTSPWPTTPGVYQTALIAPGADAPFAAEVSADASHFIYSTLATTGELRAVTWTSSFEPILAGTPNYNFPLTADAFSSVAGTSFLSKLSADGTSLVYSSYFSTPTADTGSWVSAVGTDPTGNVWIAGNQWRLNNLPLVNPLQSVPPNSNLQFPSFVSEFDSALHTLLFSTYFSNLQGGYQIAGLAADSQGHVHIAGTGPDDVPTTTSSFLTSVTPPPPNYTYNYGFVAVIDPTTAGPGICFSAPGYTSVQVGSSGQTSFAITNCGNANLNVTAVQLSSPVFALPSGANCVGTLAPQASCTVSATLTPSAAGVVTANVVVTSNAMIPTYNVQISGTGTAPVISVAPSSVTFPPQVLGDSASAAIEGVFVINNGTAPLVVYPAQAGITGSFSIKSNTCTATVAPRAACTFILAFAPTSLGNATGTLTIASDDPVHPSIAVAVSGSAISAYTTPTITGTSPQSVTKGTASLRITIHGTNFFPDSTVLIGGESFTPVFGGAGTLQVTLDPSLLTMTGEVPTSVVNPSPGGSSNVWPLTVFSPVPVSAAGLVYDSVTKLLYASVPSTATSHPNTVIPIDPATEQTGTPIPVGNNPGVLALSSDGAYLYVALNGDHALQRINLSTGQVERTFSLPPDPALGATTVLDMHGVPRSPQSVVVALVRNASPVEGGAALFNDSGLVSFIGNTYQNHNYGIDHFTFASDPSVFYAYPFSGTFFSETGVSASGLTIVTQPGFGCCNQTTGSMAASDGKLLYTNSGQVWDPASTTLLGTYSPSSGNPLFYEQSVLPDTQNQRTYFIDANAGILSFSQSTYGQDGVISFGQTLPGGLDLNRWGGDGFAFRNYSGSSSDAVILLHSSIAHSGTGGTPVLSGLSPSNAAVNSPTMQVTVTGTGFIPGTTIYWNGAPLETVYGSPTQLSILVPGTEFTSAGNAAITAVNPGGSTSPAITFNIGSGGPEVALSSSSLDFGQIVQQSSSAPQSVTLTNYGSAGLSISGIAASGDFSETSTCGATVSAAATCSISVVLTPTATGARTGMLTITDNAPGSPHTVSLAGTGLAVPVPVVTLSASQLSFGNEAQGTASAAQQVTLTNSGTVNLSISGIAASGDFSQTNTCASSVAPGSTCAIAVTFTPTAIGTRTGSLTITDSANGSPQSVALSGAGVATMVIGAATGGSTSSTVASGGVATYNLMLTAGPGFGGPISLSCSGVPQYASCTVTPGTLSPGTGGSSNFVVSISTTSSASASLSESNGLFMAGFGLFGLLTLPLLILARKRMRAWLPLSCVAAVLLFAGIIGCGGGGGANPSKGPLSTPAGTYTVTITATANGTSVSQPLTLVVQ